MDEELREIENASKQVIDLYKKAFSTTAKVGEEAVAVSGKVVSAVVTKVGEDVETYKERAEVHKEKKAARQAKKTTVKDSLGEEITSFNFTGQFTDLCYFQQADRMPLSAIANIQDQQLKKAVIDNFQMAKNQGLVEIKDGCLEITKKGKKAIQKQSFQQAAEVHQMQAYKASMEKVWNAGLQAGETQMGAVLTGHCINDFTFFNHSDTLNFNDVARFPNKKVSSQILDNINNWEQQGLISVDRHAGIARITDKGKKMLQSESFAKISNPISHKSVRGLFSGEGVFIPTIRKLNPLAQAKKGRT